MKTLASSDLKSSLSPLKEAILYSTISYYPPQDDEYQKLLAEIRSHSKSKTIDIEPFYKENDREIPAGYVARDGTRLVYTWHGTQSLEEAKNDIDVRTAKVKLTTNHEVKVHGGFAAELLSSNKSREAATRKIMKDESPSEILYTGHSLGGALAPLAAQMDNAPPSLTSVILFGAPKYATEEAAIDYNKRGLSSCTVRVEQSLDPVTALPPAIMGYIHVGHSLEVPIEISKSIHALNGGYRELIDGKHMQETFDRLTKLDLTKIISTEAYKLSFGIDSYKKVVDNMGEHLVKAYKAKNIPAPIRRTALLLGSMIRGTTEQVKVKINPNLINRQKAFTKLPSPHSYKI